MPNVYTASAELTADGGQVHVAVETHFSRIKWIYSRSCVLTTGDAVTNEESEDEGRAAHLYIRPRLLFGSRN